MNFGKKVHEARWVGHPSPLLVDPTTDSRLLAVRLLPEKPIAMVPQALGIKGAGLEEALQTLHRVCYTDKLGHTQQVLELRLLTIWQKCAVAPWWEMSKLPTYTA